MKKVAKLIWSASMLIASSALTACSSNGSSNEENPQQEEAVPCYRLTWTGAEMANNALLQKKRNKNAMLNKFKKCGIYPKRVNGEEVSPEEIEEATDALDSVSLEEGEGYEVNDIIDTRSQDLPLLIPYSALMPDTEESLNNMFIIGNHNGGIIGGNDIDNAILYPSTTISSEELTSYDLDATWTSDSKKRINDEIFNHEQKTVVNYKLVDNSGVLSSNNKSVETNLHFSVILKNDQAPTGNSVDVEFGYDVDPAELKKSLETAILANFQSKNSEATLSVKLLNNDGTEKTISDIAEEKAAKIAEAKVNKAFSPWFISFWISDSDGNEIGSTAWVTLTDKVAPVIKKDGKIVDKIELGDGNGIQLCTKDKFLEGAKILAKEKGYIFEDEIFGEIEPDFSMTEDGKLSYSFADGNENSKSDVDESLFIKNFENVEDFNQVKGNEVKCIDIGAYRYYIENYFGNWKYWNNYKPVISVTTLEVATVDSRDRERSKRQVLVFEKCVVNKGTAFEELLIPTKIRGNYSLYRKKENKESVVIVNSPIVFSKESGQFDWMFIPMYDGYFSTGYDANTSIWLCKDVIVKGKFTSSATLFKDFYMEDDEENASNAEKYYSDPKHSEYWYGSEYTDIFGKKYEATLHWNTSLADFKAKYGID